MKRRACAQQQIEEIQISSMHNNWKNKNKKKSTEIRNQRATWSTILCLIMVERSRTFIATLSPVSVFCANFTLANVPSPIVRPTSYFPTFRTTIFTDFYRITIPPPFIDSLATQNEYCSCSRTLAALLSRFLNFQKLNNNNQFFGR